MDAFFRDPAYNAPVRLPVVQLPSSVIRTGFDTGPRSIGAVRVALHRMRRRYGEILRAEIGQTLGPQGEIDAELEQLRAALKSGTHG